MLIEKHPYVSILVILLIALFQIILFTKALKFDNASQIFIFSNYISQCIQEGIFPYWNPYIHLGSPLYGDLVSRYHYPPIWLFSYTTGYSFFLRITRQLIMFCLDRLHILPHLPLGATLLPAGISQ